MNSDSVLHSSGTPPVEKGPANKKDWPLIAGWICLLLGCFTPEIFGRVFPLKTVFIMMECFSGAALLLAILGICLEIVFRERLPRGTGVFAVIAIRTKTLWEGIQLLVLSLFLIVISPVILAASYPLADLISATPIFATPIFATPIHAPSISATPNPSTEIAPPPTPAVPIPAKRSLSVNINTATLEELQSLPKIGRAKAKVIILNRPYESIGDLVGEKGITQGIFDKFRHYIKTNGPTEEMEKPE